MIKRTYSRRGFIGLTGAGVAGVAGVVGGSWVRIAAAAEAQDADLGVLNAKVYTVEARMPKAEAFAVRGGKFIAVGSTADIKGLIGKRTRTFEAAQMTIVPGFTDC